MTTTTVTDEDAAALDAVISRVGAWRGRTVSRDRIAGGNTNVSWLVTVDGESRYFVKVYGLGTDLFIDRRLAVEATIKVAQTGVAPRLLHHFPELNAEVHEYLGGFRSCHADDLQDPQVRRNIANAYRVVHRDVSLSRTQTGFDQLDERLRQARTHGARLPRDLDTLLWQCGRVERAVRAAGMTTCCCFNDGYAANYMVDAAGDVRIIDWEYASNNDPYWDLAAFSYEAFLLENDGLGELIEIHDGGVTSQAMARVTLYSGVATVVWGLWAALQSRLSRLPFDYSKYSDAVFQRGRQMMLHPRWESALRGL